MPYLITTERPLIAAIPYEEGAYPDVLLERLARNLQDIGCAVAGVIQHDLTRRDRSRCDMSLEDLSTGETIGLSEDRGAAARGCRIDQAGLVQAAALIDRALREAKPEFLIINKFGKIECEGGGLRNVLALAFELGIPAIIGVPIRNIEAWQTFAGDCFESIAADWACIAPWVAARVTLSRHARPDFDRRLRSVFELGT